MQDQLFIREWTERHEQFSADIDSGLGQLTQHLRHHRRGEESIGNAYGIARESGARSQLSSAARGSLRGLAASVITLVVLVTIAALAAPMADAASPVAAAAGETSSCGIGVALA